MLAPLPLIDPLMQQSEAAAELRKRSADTGSPHNAGLLQDSPSRVKLSPRGSQPDKPLAMMSAEELQQVKENSSRMIQSMTMGSGVSPMVDPGMNVLHDHGKGLRMSEGGLTHQARQQSFTAM